MTTRLNRCIVLVSSAALTLAVILSPGAAFAARKHGASKHGNRHEPRAIRLLREQQMRDRVGWRERAAQEHRLKHARKYR